VDHDEQEVNDGKTKNSVNRCFGLLQRPAKFFYPTTIGISPINS